MTDPSAAQSAVTAVELPDPDFKRRASSLVGVDDLRCELTAELTMVLRPAAFDDWAKSKRLGVDLVQLIRRRSPLFIIAGDVGTGKTEIAETIGDTIARDWNISITLFRLGLSARGSGLVGEMSRLIAHGFAEVIRTSQRWTTAGADRAAGILFIDEADAFAQSRELGQMHHEDRAGVNALIRGIDDLGRAQSPLAVIMATNRLSSIDPAILRRAGHVFELDRPNRDQRTAVFQRFLAALPGFRENLDMLVTLTGPTDQRSYGFTYSDLTQRLIPSAVLSEFPSGTVSLASIIKMAESMAATPPFGMKASPSDG